MFEDIYPPKDKTHTTEKSPWPSPPASRTRKKINLNQTPQANSSFGKMLSQQNEITLYAYALHYLKLYDQISHPTRPVVVSIDQLLDQLVQETNITLDALERSTIIDLEAML